MTFDVGDGEWCSSGNEPERWKLNSSLQYSSELMKGKTTTVSAGAAVLIMYSNGAYVTGLVLTDVNVVVYEARSAHAGNEIVAAEQSF